MVPSLITLGTAALALAGEAAAKQFVLADTYDSTNFLDKFDFFESRYGTGNYNDVDPTSGYINYRNRADAEKLGLVNTNNGEVFLGVDSKNKTSFPGVGRSSVRLESKVTYNKHLMVARFTHLPKPVCGAWTAFWSYGSPWPTKGELDWFEGWNNMAVNKPAAHTYLSSEQGECTISSTGQTAQVETPNCDNAAVGQYSNQGCTAAATSADPWGSSEGGVYAVEWTDDYIKFFSWRHAAAPKNIDSDSPDTASWGTPSMLLANDKCNIANHFKDQRLVINLDFCGVLAGDSGVWGGMCAASTGHQQCSTYVAENPTAFSDTFFKVKDIRIFKEGTKPITSTTSAATSTTTSSTKSSITSTSTTSTSTTKSSTTSTSATLTSTSTTSSTTTSAVTSTKTSTEDASTTLSTTSTKSAPTSSSDSATVTATASGSVTADASSTNSHSASGASTTAYTNTTITASAPGSVTDKDFTTTTSVTASSAPYSNTTFTRSAPGSVTDKDVTKTASITASASGSVTNKDVSKTISDKQTHITPSASLSSSGSSSVELITSTVYTTKVETITSCAPTITDCGAQIGKVVTKTIALYTTVCPVTVTPAPKPTEPATGGGDVPKDKDHPGPEVRTTVYTKTYVLTKCPSTVPDCPIGSLTTKVITKTSTPESHVPEITKPATTGKPAGPDVTKIVTLTNKVPGGNGEEEHHHSKGNDGGKPDHGNTVKPPGTNSTVVAVPTKPSTLTAAKSSGTAPGASAPACSGPGCPITTKPATVNGAVQAGASFALMALGAVAVFIL
ncbi:beta-1,3-endoglucanase [Colletotrichum musicola]|uniref:Beta-1,3-endoglucanase n=1 Tax=Colletotrichum musicola TaxID=2175873 RepID=A0A8H6NTI2_9PEZI|nr:beta-1,3-endoglucanase [Colletotrichum musicola]